jgi:hypothetical protein
MDAEIVLLLFIALGLIIGAGLGWVAAFRIGGPSTKITKLERDLAWLKQLLVDKSAQPATPETAPGLRVAGDRFTADNGAVTAARPVTGTASSIAIRLSGC